MNTSLIDCKPLEYEVDEFGLVLIADEAQFTKVYRPVILMADNVECNCCMPVLGEMTVYNCW